MNIKDLIEGKSYLHHRGDDTAQVLVFKEMHVYEWYIGDAKFTSTDGCDTYIYDEAQVARLISEMKTDGEIK